MTIPRVYKSHMNLRFLTTLFSGCKTESFDRLHRHC